MSIQQEFYDNFHLTLTLNDISGDFIINEYDKCIRYGQVDYFPYFKISNGRTYLKSEPFNTTVATLELFNNDINIKCEIDYLGELKSIVSTTTNELKCDEFVELSNIINRLVLKNEVFFKQQQKWVSYFNEYSKYWRGLRIKEVISKLKRKEWLKI